MFGVRDFAAYSESNDRGRDMRDDTFYIAIEKTAVAVTCMCKFESNNPEEFYNHTRYCRAWHDATPALKDMVEKFLHLRKGALA